MVKESRSRHSIVSRSPRKKPSDEWWSIKDIIDEDRHRYLVKWEPDLVASKEYPASWVAKEDVTQTAVDEWNSNKQRRLCPLVQTPAADNRLRRASSLEANGKATHSEHEGLRKPLEVLVVINCDSQFPRENFSTQLWSQSTSSQQSRLTQSWQGSSQDISVAISKPYQSPNGEAESFNSSVHSLGISNTLQTPSTQALLQRSRSKQPSSHQAQAAEAFHYPALALHSCNQTNSNSQLRSSGIPCTSRAENIESGSDRSDLRAFGIIDFPRTNMATPSNSGRFNPAPSPPMQDRVRSIRNSAISSQSRRANGDGNFTGSSRASSVVSESPVLSLADSRTVEIAAPYEQMDSPPEESIDVSVTSNKQELVLPTSNDRERFISLPLPGRVRDQYDQTIQYFQKDINSFLAGTAEGKYTHTMRQLIRRLNNISTHVDLENEPTQTQPDVSAQDEAKWATSSSNKFVYIGALLNELRRHNMHIAIVAGQARLRDIIARFLQGSDFTYVRTDGGNQHLQANSKDALKITIASGSTESGPVTVDRADVLVMLDGYVGLNDAQIQELRGPNDRHGISPVIYPIVYCSAEHLSLCIERMDEIASEEDKLRALITAINERKPEVGAIEDEEYPPQAAAEETACMLTSRSTYLTWTVLAVRPVKVNGLEKFLTGSRQIGSESIDGARTTRGETPNIRKRPFEDATNLIPELPKRQRLTPAPELSNPGEVALSFETKWQDLRQALNSAERMLAERSAKTTALEAVILEKDEAMVEYRKAMDNLQTRFEKAKRSRQQVAQEHGELMQQMETNQKQLEFFKLSVDRLKDEAKRLETDLQAARSELLTSSLPKVAEMEQLRKSNRELLFTKETLQRKVESITAERDYTRDQYQAASSAAVEAIARIRQLEEEIESLRQKASGEAARLRELTEQSESETHLSQLRRLRLENDELREQLRKRERGRGMTTRTGSVAPRSPRLAPSPGRSRAGSRAPGSRAGSPVRSSFGARKGRTMVEQAL